MSTTTRTPGAFLCQVGSMRMHRSDDASAYVLSTSDGEIVGTYPTAQAANAAALARITAAYKARA